MAHVADWKKQEVSHLEKLAKEYPVVGVVNLGIVPGRQIQKIRATMRGEDTVVRMSRKNLMSLALKNTNKKGIEKLSEHITGQGGLLFSKANPFKIYKNLEKNKTRAPAKPNSIAPRDISVSKGDTPFPPGPILGELQMAGIPAAIEKGKVVIKQNKIIVKAGDKISPGVANALSKLEIEPFEIKLDVLAAYEDGVIYTPDILAVDSEKILMDVSTAHQQAVNLSINATYLTKQTAALGVSFAASNARNLAINAVIYEKEVVDLILTSAQQKANALKAVADKDTGEESK